MPIGWFAHGSKLLDNVADAGSCAKLCLEFKMRLKVYDKLLLFLLWIGHSYHFVLHALLKPAQAVRSNSFACSPCKRCAKMLPSRWWPSSSEACNSYRQWSHPTPLPAGCNDSVACKPSSRTHVGPKTYDLKQWMMSRPLHHTELRPGRYSRRIVFVFLFFDGDLGVCWWLNAFYPDLCLKRSMVVLIPTSSTKVAMLGFLD